MPKPRWIHVLLFVLTMILGASIGAWCMYPDLQEPAGSLMHLGMLCGSLLGLVLCGYFAPLIRIRVLIISWLATALTAIIVGQTAPRLNVVLEYQNRAFRAELIAWSSVAVFVVICSVAAIAAKMRSRRIWP
jgi:hypothetical protein